MRKHKPWGALPAKTRDTLLEAGMTWLDADEQNEPAWRTLRDAAVQALRTNENELPSALRRAAREAMAAGRWSDAALLAQVETTALYARELAAEQSGLTEPEELAACAWGTPLPPTRERVEAETRGLLAALLDDSGAGTVADLAACIAGLGAQRGWEQ